MPTPTPTPLPLEADLAGAGPNPTSDVFRAAIRNLRAFLAEKLGTSGTNSDALTALGASPTGKGLFSVQDPLTLAKLIGAGTLTLAESNLKVLLGIANQIQIGSTVVTTDAFGMGTITFPEEFFARTGQPQPVRFAIVALGDAASMSPIAAVPASYTSTTMQIKCAASVTIRVNWLATAPFVAYL